MEAMRELSTELKTGLSNLVALKMRLPILQAFMDAFNAMSERGETVVRNDVVLQLVRDSFDMLVIDLASLCEGLTKGGFFASLKEHAGLLRRFAPDDVEDRRAHV